MADQALIFPMAGIRGWEEEKESSSRKSLFNRVLTWYRSGDGVVQRQYSSSFSRITDPKTGAYERMY
jgi:hypothetical protein